MNLRIIARTFIVCILCFISFVIGSLIEEQYYMKMQPQILQKEKEIIYLEIPVKFEEEQIEIDFKENFYTDYMDKLTLDNCEYWWHGYNIMMESWEDQPEHLTDIYTEEELEYLYRAVETETYGADFLSKANVANVIFNRIENDNWGNDFKSVVTSPNQFSYFRKSISESTKEACAFAFEIEDTTNGALFFHSGGMTYTFNGANYMFTDNCGHHFYK